MWCIASFIDHTTTMAKTHADYQECINCISASSTGCGLTYKCPAGHSYPMRNQKRGCETSGWFFNSPSISCSDSFIFPYPSQPSRSRSELSWWLLDTATLKPFHQRPDMFKSLWFRQLSPRALAHMGSRCHGSLTGGSPVTRELFTLRWGIQGIWGKKAWLFLHTRLYSIRLVHT